MKLIRSTVFAFSLLAAAPAGFAFEPDEEPDPLRTEAEGGDSVAQFKLGSEYFYGVNGRKTNVDIAVYWFRQAADKGLPQAQFNFAICLERGLGVARDPNKALEYYERAEKNGILPAGMNRALLLLYGAEKDLPEDRQLKPDPLKAMLVLEGLCIKKYAPAMIELAACLLRANEPTGDMQIRAYELLNAASELPDVTGRGLAMLADCCLQGIGCSPDRQRAIELLRRAAKKNDADAMIKLATFYEVGVMIKGDKLKAFALTRRAAMQGHPQGEYKYAEFLVAGMEDGKGLDEAMEFYCKSAEHNYPPAIHKLAQFAEHGTGMDAPDRKKAMELYLRAAQLGHAPSQYALGCILFSGADGIPQDEKQAFYWFAQAALRDYPAAMRRVGQCYYDGRGCEKDNEKAVKWLENAASAGDFTAIEMLEKNSRNAW